jgi:ribosomal protein S18 acetylase RimI-like enzyme
MIIRPVTDHDAAKCTKIANEAFRDEIKRGMNEFIPEYFINRIERPSLRLMVAYEDDVLGFVLVTDANAFVPAQLHLVAVDKKQRGKGIGKELVQFAMNITKENGWGKLKLSTRPWNHVMRNLCNSLGFIEEAHLRKEYLNEDLIQYGYFP